MRAERQGGEGPVVRQEAREAADCARHLAADVHDPAASLYLACFDQAVGEHSVPENVVDGRIGDARHQVHLAVADATGVEAEPVDLGECHDGRFDGLQVA